MYGRSKSMVQPGMVANPARGKLNRENEYFLSAFVPENLVSRDGFGSPVVRQPAPSQQGVHEYSPAQDQQPPRQLESRVHAVDQ